MMLGRYICPLMSRPLQKIDVSKLSYSELQELKRKIQEVENNVTREYDIHLTIRFKANRPKSDLDDPESLEGTLTDIIFDAFGLDGGEDVHVKEITEVEG